MMDIMDNVEKYYCFLFKTVGVSPSRILKIRAEEIGIHRDDMQLWIGDEHVGDVNRSEVDAWWVEWREGKKRNHPVTIETEETPQQTEGRDPLPGFLKNLLRAVNWGSYPTDKQWTLGGILVEANAGEKRQSPGVSRRHGQYLYDFLESLGFQKIQIHFGKYPKYRYVFKGVK